MAEADKDSTSNEHAWLRCVPVGRGRGQKGGGGGQHPLFFPLKPTLSTTAVSLPGRVGCQL